MSTQYVTCPRCNERSVPVEVWYTSASGGLPEHSMPADGEVEFNKACEDCGAENFTVEEGEKMEAQAWAEYDPCNYPEYDI